jgi:hypothetical protein
VAGTLAVAAVGGALLSFGGPTGPSSGGVLSLALNLTGGGGSSSGGAYALQGAVTQPSIVGSAGGAYELTAGLFGIAVLRTPGTPSIGVRFTEDKLAELSWTGDASEFVLEFSPTVGPGAVWEPVSPQPTGNSFVTPCKQPARFFRFRKP